MYLDYELVLGGASGETRAGPAAADADDGTAGIGWPGERGRPGLREA